jgi:hypothetical protein
MELQGQGRRLMPLPLRSGGRRRAFASASGLALRLLPACRDCISVCCCCRHACASSSRGWRRARLGLQSTPPVVKGCWLVERDLQRSALASTQRPARPGWQHVTAPLGTERLRATVRTAPETNRALIPEPPDEAGPDLVPHQSRVSGSRPARDSAPEGGARARRPYSADGA